MPFKEMTMQQLSQFNISNADAIRPTVIRAWLHSTGKYAMLLRERRVLTTTGIAEEEERVAFVQVYVCDDRGIYRVTYVDLTCLRDGCESFLADEVNRLIEAYHPDEVEMNGYLNELRQLANMPDEHGMSRITMQGFAHYRTKAPL